MFPSSTKVFKAIRRIERQIASINAIHQEICDKSKPFMDIIRVQNFLICIRMNLSLMQDDYIDACVIFTKAIVCFSRQQMAAYEEKIFEIESMVTKRETEILEFIAKIHELIL